MKKLIKDTMEKILFGDTSILKLLRKQYYHSSIINIDLSEAGCYVDFQVDKNLEKTNPANLEIGDVYLKTTDMKFGMGTILFVRNGYISMLEFYTYGGDDPVPKSFSNYVLSYGDNDVRDFSSYFT